MAGRIRKEEHVAYCKVCEVYHILAKYCPVHGRRLTDFRCVKCHRIVDTNQKYCEQCGTDLQVCPPQEQEA